MIMLKKILFTTVFLFLLIFICNSAFADNLNYSITTELPDKDPYYIGTFVKDLSIYFTNDLDKVVNNDLNYLNVKLGNLDYKFLKEKDNKYHLRNFYVLEEHVINSRFSIEIKTPLEQPNVKKSYAVKDISNYLKLKNNINNFSKLTVGEKIQLYLEFESLKDISNLNCFIQYNNVKSNLNCERNVCIINFLVPETLNEINFVCNYEKTIDNLKSKYPFVINLRPELLTGIYIKEITNPEKKVIKNPFEVCFNIYYKSNRLLRDYYNLDLYVNNVKTNFYDKENNYCFNKFLFPYTKLDLDLTLIYDDSEYYFNYNEKLKPGLFWILVFVFVILFIIVNVIFIIRSLVSKEDLDSLVSKRDSYQARLKLIKEKYLQGNLDKKEFEKDLQEYTIKISWLNEQILRLRKQSKSNSPKFLPKNLETSQKAPKELLNVLDDNNFESNDLFIDETKVEDKQKMNFFDSFKNWFKNLKDKLKPKPKDKVVNESLDNKKDLESIFNSEKNLDKPKEEFKIDSEEEINLDNEFDIRKWQK